MKTFITSTLFLFFVSMHSFSQTSNFEANKIATFCKVWGFLKYHHPAVAKGKYDWDKVFLEKITTVETLNSKEELNNFYYSWINSLGKLKTDSYRTPPANAILSNYDSTWYKDTNVFSDKVVDLLTQVKNNSRSKNHYVKKKMFGLAAASYENENLYKDSVYPSAEMRLLALSRYWNVMNYFYPYKYLTDTKWQDVIVEFVPQFVDAKNIKEYHLSMSALFATISDSHTVLLFNLHSSNVLLPPFNNKIVEDKVIVLNAFNDTLCKNNDIQYGDVISKINGQSIKDYISYYSKYLSASNYGSLCFRLAPYNIWSDLQYPATITYDRNGNTFEKTLAAYPYTSIFKNWQALTLAKNDTTTEKYRMLENNIAYVNLKNLKSKKEAKEVLKNIGSTKGVILDIRNYPNSSIFTPVTNFFCPSKKAFAKFAHQSIKYPGALNAPKTLYCGKKGGVKYNGKVIVLTNESTQSFAEYFTMALKTIPGVILIGNNTAGADGSIKYLTLPGSIRTSFSNEAAYYPDGKQTQRIGITPDIKVLPTIEGVRLRKDEVLDKAVEVLGKAVTSGSNAAVAGK